MRVLGWVIGALGGIVVLLALLWFGYGFYVDHIVSANPSTAPVIKTDYGEFRLGQYSGGNQLADPVSPGSSQPRLGVAQDGQANAAPVASATPFGLASRPVLPPTQLVIPKIGVDYPVVASHNDNLPKFKGVGWYIGTGFPGFRGNMVLFGHLNGDYETFGRLDELNVGDGIVVQAMGGQYHYKVTETKVVSKDAVEVMAPTADYRATLITCTGDFIPLTRDYTHRLIVIAQLDQGERIP